MRHITVLFALLALMGCAETPFHGLTLMDMQDMEHTGEPNLQVSEQGEVTLSYLREHGGMTTLYLRTLSDAGWSSPKPVTQGKDLLVNWADFPSIIAANDRLIAHWLVRQEGPAFAYDVYTASSDDGGDRWTTAKRLHADTSDTEHGFVSLYAVEDGVGAFWLDGQRYAQAGQSKGMELRHRLLGSKDSDSEEIVDALVCDCCHTDAIVVDGSPVVVYRDRTENEIRDISLARLTDTGWVKTSAGTDGWRISGCPVNGPAIAQNNGIVGVAWFTAVPSNRVRVAFSFDGASSFDVPIDVVTEHPLGRVDLVVTPDGRAMVSWLAQNQGGFRFREVMPDGETGDVIKVASMETRRASGFPKMVETDGELIFAWTDTAGSVPRVRTSKMRLP